MLKQLLFTLPIILSSFQLCFAKEKATEYYDLGGFHYEVSTQSPEAQVWFDRGLAMCHGFNHEEAVRCFQKAVAADPGMAMAYWGMAYAWGPNINNMLIEPHQIAQADLAIQLAKLHVKDSDNLEKELIDALAARYAVPVPEDREELNLAYVDAMQAVYQLHPKNPLVAALYAESMLNMQPWKHWSPEGTPGKYTPEIQKVIEEGLRHSPDHPALCHFYIHTMEASPTPEKALTAANSLRNRMPGQGHLLHMPSHIDIWLGDYHNVILANQKGIKADTAFVENEGPYNFYSLYRIHNYHFLVYGAMFDGQSEIALQAARDLKKQIPEEMLRAQIDFLDAFMPTELHVLVRFGQWEQILKEPEPADYLPMSRSIWHYARGLAYAALEEVDKAEAEYQSFEEVRDTVPETSFLFQNASLNILEIADAMLSGEIAYRRGEFDKAFDYLSNAVELDDALNYDEPWGWMQPARHALGALMLEQGRFEECESIYREDLKRHPNNPWALHGLAESLKKQGKAEEAASCRKEFEMASERSDIKIDRSCYCRLQAEQE